MKIISRTFHAWLDYMSCAVLLAAPWALKFSDSEAATAVAIGAGLLILFSSLMTKYEGGVFRMIPMSMHLTLDVLLGIFLIASPWLFAFQDKIQWPHILFGILAIFSGLFTERKSTREASAIENI
ncbi:MAG: SPW repeat domain-containing protein [Pedobacter sp.]